MSALVVAVGKCAIAMLAVAAAAAVEIRIVYDNHTLDSAMRPDWGFAAFVQAGGSRILFDTGADGELLLRNLLAAGIAPGSITHVVISHRHPDHRNGLASLALKNRSMQVYFLDSFPQELYELATALALVPRRVRGPLEIAPGAFTTGAVEGNPDEQALVLTTSRGLVLLTGCSHPGLARMIEAARSRHSGAPVRLLVGGFHLYRLPEAAVAEQVAQLAGLGVEAVAPAHCTGELARRMLRQAFGPRYFAAGAGWRLVLE